jgi:hypothetical protein
VICAPTDRGGLGKTFEEVKRMTLYQAKLLMGGPEKVGTREMSAVEQAALLESIREQRKKASSADDGRAGDRAGSPGDPNQPEMPPAMSVAVDSRIPRNVISRAISQSVGKR